MVISERLRDLLTRNNLIHLIVKTSEETDRYYLDISTDGCFISYITAQRLPLFEGDFWNESLRAKHAYKVKPTKIMQLLHGKELRYHVSLEILYLFKDMSKYVVEVVEGNEIGKYYNEEYYDEARGELFNSCMSQKPAGFFMMYKDLCKMIVVKNKETDKITARAILYPEVHSMSGFCSVPVVGKRYGCDDIYSKMIEEYALDNGMYLFESGRLSKYLVINKDRELIEIDNFSPIFKTPSYVVDKYSRIPYVDNFQYAVFSEDMSYLSTTIPGKQHVYMCIQDTDGTNVEHWCEGCTMDCDSCYSYAYGYTDGYYGDDDDPCYNCEDDCDDCIYN